MNTLGAVIGWIFFGIIIGGLARLLVPGRQSMGCLPTIMLGVAGSFAGGAVSALFTGGDLLRPAGFLMSILGGVLVLAVFLMVTRKG